MKKSRRILITGLSIVLAASAALSIYLYKENQQEEALQNQLLLDQGIAFYKQANYTEALQTLENIAPGAAQDWQVPYYKGATLVRLKNYQQAATQLEESKLLNSSETQILYLLGVVYYKLGNLELAEGYFAATLELDPDHEQARGLMGVMSNLQKAQEQPGSPPQNPTPPDDS
jgi:Flp pilus assembly protein TadD